MCGLPCGCCECLGKRCLADHPGHSHWPGLKAFSEELEQLVSLQNEKEAADAILGKPIEGALIPKCPRRVEGPFRVNDGDDVWAEHEGARRCSYCGSMHPDDVFAAIAEGVELGPTDKNYKVYVGRTGKFYFQHFDEAQCRRFIDLLNAKQLKIGFPGHFYARPFFIAVPEAKG